MCVHNKRKSRARWKWRNKIYKQSGKNTMKLKASKGEWAEPCSVCVCAFVFGCSASVNIICEWRRYSCCIHPHIHPTQFDEINICFYSIWHMYFVLAQGKRWRRAQLNTSTIRRCTENYLCASVGGSHTHSFSWRTMWVNDEYLASLCWQVRDAYFGRRNRHTTYNHIEVPIHGRHVGMPSMRRLCDV